MFDRLKLMGRYRQATSSPIQVTLTDTVRDIHQLQRSGKRLQLTNQERSRPTEPTKSLYPEKIGRQGHREGAMRFYKSHIHLKRVKAKLR